MDVDQATQTMIDNVPAKTGRALAEWFAVIDAAGVDGHAKIVAELKSDHGVTHGFANLIAKLYLARGAAPDGDDDLLDAQYAGKKAALRPVYEQVAVAATALGDDVVVSVKKTAVGFRRAKQFAYVEVPSAARVRVGLNLKGEPATDRLKAAGGMCTHAVDLTAPEGVDDELLGWLRAAYDRAG